MKKILIFFAFLFFIPVLFVSVFFLHWRWEVYKLPKHYSDIVLKRCSPFGGCGRSGCLGQAKEYMEQGFLIANPGCPDGFRISGQRAGCGNNEIVPCLPVNSQYR